MRLLVQVSELKIERIIVLNVLSLFDGMSCGQIALNRAGIKYQNYYASEIDKYAITVTQANYPNTIQLGDIENWRLWNIDWQSIDLIFGGSPCQGFSFAGNQLAFDDPRSKLFFTFVDIVNHVKKMNPNLKFMLENVRMKKEHLNVISECLGVEPVFINSSLVSAQNRQRFYWANWTFKEPEDKGIVLTDILEEGFVDRDKSYCIDASYYKGGNLNSYYKSSRRQIVFHPAAIVGRRLDSNNVRQDYDKSIPIRQILYVLDSNKSRCLSTVGKDCVVSWLDVGMYKDAYLKYRDFFRNLTPIECERLQTVPDNYTNFVSNSQRYKMLGNGWTVDVIAHILKEMKK